MLWEYLSHSTFVSEHTQKKRKKKATIAFVTVSAEVEQSPKNNGFLLSVV